MFERDEGVRVSSFRRSHHFRERGVLHSAFFCKLSKIFYRNGSAFGHPSSDAQQDGALQPHRVLEFVVLDDNVGVLTPGGGVGGGCAEEIRSLGSGWAAVAAVDVLRVEIFDPVEWFLVDVV